MAQEAKDESKQELQSVRPARGVNPFEDMERAFDTYFGRGWLRPLRWDWPSLGAEVAPFEGKMPRVDLIERDAEIVVRAELPGVDKKDIDVSITRNAITIKGRTHREEKEEKGNYYRSEISTGAYSRTLSLPADVDADKAKAAFKDGILELTVPKVEKSERRKVKVE